jgi:hypothetical protein
MLKFSSAKPPTVLDLEELELIDVEAVRFLNTCETNGMLLLHCSPYIRKWMAQERDRHGFPDINTEAGAWLCSLQDHHPVPRTFED